MLFAILSLEMQRKWLVDMFFSKLLNFTQLIDNQKYKLMKSHLKAGFDNYDAPGQVRCKINRPSDNNPRTAESEIIGSGFEWNRNIGSCKTCASVDHSPEIRKKCRLSK